MVGSAVPIRSVASGSVLTLAGAEEGRRFAGLDPHHRAPELEEEAGPGVFRKLALRGHGNSPIVFHFGDIVYRRSGSHRAAKGAALQDEHMSFATI